MANEFVIRNGLKSYGSLNITGNTTMTGDLIAASKSFDIPHPTKKEYRIQYGVLEGPEHGIYYRGRTQLNVIELPDYWKDLIDETTISIQLTLASGPDTVWVEKIENNQIFLNSLSGNIDVFYIIYAERKDVKKVLKVYKPL